MDRRGTLAAFVAAQSIAGTVLARRLWPGRRRPSPVMPVLVGDPADVGQVSALVATLNEAHRIGPCLLGLRRQTATLGEVLVVDSQSTDGTAALVADAAHADPRIRLVIDPPLPDGWIGKVWALQHGLSLATGEWVLGLDADTEPAAGMIDAVLAAARHAGYDVVSFAPCFAGQTAGERWLQPALLATLIYRFGVPGIPAPAARVMANGQCFLARRDVLRRFGGYASARASFSDDITLARHLAAAGVRVGFLDGAHLLSVRAYPSAREMWHEWGRSIDAKDATTPVRHWIDVAVLALVLAAPVPVLCLLAAQRRSWLVGMAAGVNIALLALRYRIQAAFVSSYERRGIPFWLSPLADPLAVVRIVLSSLHRPTRWRGRRYP